MAFVHLHNHTVFSMLDGATRIQDMVNRAVELGMPAVAITDHGYMYGVPDLALACDAVNHNTPEYKTWSHDKAFLEKDRRDELVEPDPEENPREHAQYVKDMAMWDEKGNIDELKPPLVIKPIFGCEVYFTPDETLARDHKPELYHMILLAKDQEGYVNLMQTVSEAAVQGFYYKPRVTLDNLRRHAKGMICTSACIAGIIPKYIDRGDMEGAIKWAETFRDTFDPGDFYIEIQEHGITTDNGLTDEQMDRTLIDIAKQVGVNVAERAKAKGIENVVFDRGGYVYHGRVKALAEGAREGGFPTQRTADAAATRLCDCEEAVANRAPVIGVAMAVTTGACRYCGQIQEVGPHPSQAAADDTATEVCNCPTARQERRVHEQVADACERVQRLFGDDAESLGFKPIPDEAVGLLENVVEMIARGPISSASLNVRGRCKAKFSVTSKGKIKVSRSETRSCDLEDGE